MLRLGLLTPNGFVLKRNKRKHYLNFFITRLDIFQKGLDPLLYNNMFLESVKNLNFLFGLKPAKYFELCFLLLHQRVLPLFFNALADT